MKKFKQDKIKINSNDAYLVWRAWLPRNPNKCRTADPEVVEATKRFEAAVRKVIED